MRLSRRAFASSLAGVALAACGKGGERCSTCGMKIEPQSAFRAEMALGGETRAFDTPRCALIAYRKKAGTLRVQEFYSRGYKDGGDVRFVDGSDVQGPMGPDLIPVDPAKVDKFEHDHGGTRALALLDVDDAVLRP